MERITHERTPRLREVMVTVRMTAREAAALAALAAAHDCTKSDFLRRLVRRAIGTDAVPVAASGTEVAA